MKLPAVEFIADLVKNHVIIFWFLSVKNHVCQNQFPKGWIVHSSWRTADSSVFLAKICTPCCLKKKEKRERELRKPAKNTDDREATCSRVRMFKEVNLEGAGSRKQCRENTPWVAQGCRSGEQNSEHCKHLDESTAL